MQEFQFGLPAGETADLDEAVIRETMKEKERFPMQ